MSCFPPGLSTLDKYLLENSFIDGVEPTDADSKVFRSLKESSLKEIRLKIYIVQILVYYFLIMFSLTL